MRSAGPGAHGTEASFVTKTWNHFLIGNGSNVIIVPFLTINNVEDVPLPI